MLPQRSALFAADAFFKAAVSLVPEVPKTINIDGKMRPSEAFLLEFLCNFFSTLLIVPVSGGQMTPNGLRRADGAASRC